MQQVERPVHRGQSFDQRKRDRMIATHRQQRPDARSPLRRRNDRSMVRAIFTNGNVTQVDDGQVAADLEPAFGGGVAELRVATPRLPDGRWRGRGAAPVRRIDVGRNAEKLDLHAVAQAPQCSGIWNVNMTPPSLARRDRKRLVLSWLASRRFITKRAVDRPSAAPAATSEAQCWL